MTCDRLWQVDAVEAGRLSPSDGSFKRHQRVCEECRSRAAASDKLRSMLRALPDPTPGELGLRRLRERILREAATPGEPWWTVRRATIVATALVALVALVIGGRFVLHARDGGPELRWAGSVVPVEGARWLQARAANVERVSLLDGEIRVFVRKQAADERFLVVVPDGEIEVRGTTFDVVVRAGATRHVHVVEGVVVLRIRDGQQPTLTAGQTWDLPSEARTEPVLPPAGPTGAAAAEATAVRAPELARSRVTVATPANTRVTWGTPPDPRATGATPAADDWMPDYELAMGLYRSGRFERAAEAFDRFASGHPGASTVDDALFLQAAALARAGRGDAAALVAVHQIERFPESFHRKDAAILVARAARDRKDCEAARRALGPWLAKHDPDATRELGTCL
jgi:TolA-binding protein